MTITISVAKEEKTENLHRKLTAIMFTDIFQYSRLMSRDEQKGYRMLSDHDAIAERVISSLHGRIPKGPGNERGTLYEIPILVFLLVVSLAVGFGQYGRYGRNGVLLGTAVTFAGVVGAVFILIGMVAGSARLNERLAGHAWYLALRSLLKSTDGDEIPADCFLPASDHLRRLASGEKGKDVRDDQGQQAHAVNLRQEMETRQH